MNAIPEMRPSVVFRLRGLPATIGNASGVASLVSERLGDVTTESVRVFSIARTLAHWENPPSKVATLTFMTTPSLVRDDLGKNEWSIPGKTDCSDELILDLHFMGMTPLNDVDSVPHAYDCIAISGLASHPFGSWQPRGDDKSFMWIRDELPRQLQGCRTVIYGYDTRLNDSNSFQNIPDLAKQLISHLQAYGWALPSARPIAFLAHSLGGIVLKQALVQLADSSDEEYKSLMRILHGVVFFGVPNLGMQQEHFRTIAQNNANAALVDDLARNSSYLRQLDTDFSEGSFSKRITCFWAYETVESPIVLRTMNGKISRDGPPAILVSRESATRRLIECNSIATFPINYTHSDMVKFTRSSHYIDIVRSKLVTILSPRCESESGTTNGDSQDDGQPTTIGREHNYTLTAPHPPSTLLSKCDNSQGLQKSSLTAELNAFTRLSGLEWDDSIDFEAVRKLISELQSEQERNDNLMYLKRLEPFLIEMQQFEKVASAVDVFSSLRNIMAYVWGPLQYALRVTSALPNALNSILDAYHELGEQLPHLQASQSRFASSPYLKEVLVMIYKDIMWFHTEVILRIKHRQWAQLFGASWRDFQVIIEHITGTIGSNRRLLEGRVSRLEFEQMLNLRVSSKYEFNKIQKTQIADRRVQVMQWLSPFDCDAEQDRYRRTRSICKDPGRWLIEDDRFQDWFRPHGSSTPLLWLSGIPGAGKTILASVVIDAARNIPGANVLFFYCREALLSSIEVAQDMIKIALSSYDMLYLVVDGLDECKREDRKDIASLFQDLVEELTATDTGSIRCLFVSQEDGAALHDFRSIPSIKITHENKEDIKSFADEWHQVIERKFGSLAPRNHHISEIICARAQGMFIFAEMFAKYLENQQNVEDLLEELEPHKLPVTLEHVYERIISRICESQGGQIANTVQKVLGWIVCAQRPLRWYEIQGALCIDTESQHINHDREIADSPKGLFASLVEVRGDGAAELVHGSAREFLIKKNIIETQDADYSLAMLSLAYLTLPQFDQERDDDEVKSDLLSGIHAFHDYASACWYMHLQSCFPKLKPGDDDLACLQETLEAFIELHWSSKHKPLSDLKRVQKSLRTLETSRLYEKIIQAVGWAKKQHGADGQGPCLEEALDISEHHMNKHTRPYQCSVIGCHMAIFGCTTIDELNRHLITTHGIYRPNNDKDEPQYPDPPKETPTSTAKKTEKKFQCDECDVSFTRKHNLTNHKRTHAGDKPYSCFYCGKNFTRLADCDRHENTQHGVTQFICRGPLKSGSTWGCGAPFVRADKLADHLRTSKGQKCVRPLVLERLQESGGGGGSDGVNADDDDEMFAHQIGENADALLAAGKFLPSFKKFLQICGLDSSIIGGDSVSISKATTSSTEEDLKTDTS
ncbi:uncharacterized protein JN550_004795 [Neoarthrinium moseri]|uniref:uncharacterized protein n=1 Tax=Neoarthrinium moseri TaxID=1658444 RepID=UPI001FDCAF9A|nr:uncharacterized protein JN550_004795 [Neoarthrinium moseri]KAI1871350.1 hypothetical protein JN550_004795 [Neoarthrinium moseri]